MSYTENLSQERVNVFTGQKLGDMLLKHYSELFQHQNEHDPKWKMFAEIIMRVTNDVAGNRYAIAADHKQFSSFDRIFEALASEDAVKKLKELGVDAFNAVLAVLPTFTKGIVQTPHPTEVLRPEAIVAEDRLHNLLENDGEELFNGGAKEPFTRTSKIMTAMNHLYEELKPLEKALEPWEEMKRSIEFSEVMFDSVPIVMQTILEGAERNHAFDPAAQKLDHQQLSMFNFLIRPETWSPGDRDSKAQMTAEMLKDGVKMNREGMALHYIRKLADIAEDLEKNPDSNILVPDHSDSILGWHPVRKKDPMTGELIIEGPRLKDVVTGMMARLMADVAPEEVRKGKGRGRDAEIIEEVLARCIEEKHALNNEPKFVERYAYKDAADLIADLTYLREIPGAHFEDYKFPDKERKAYFSKADALLVQANNFGLSALRSQIRENREMHEEVMLMILRALAEENIMVPGWVDSDDKKMAIKSAMQPKVVNALIEKLMSDEGSLIHDRLKKKLADIGSSLQQHKKDNDGWDKFYETLKGFEIAAENPDVIPRYLIAECRDSTDILAAFFMLKAMESNETRQDYTEHKVEIVPLFEYRDHVQASPETVADAYQNCYFREHHLALTDPQDPAITESILHPKTKSQTTSETKKRYGFEVNQLTNVVLPERRHITVAEAKERYGIETFAAAKTRGEAISDEQLKQDQKEIKAQKVVMYAGSDITKSAGSGGAGLVMQTTNRMRERLLNMDDPVLLVDYTGVGGGVHRSSPVATSFETAQGRSLRQTPQSIAQKILIQAGRAVRKVLNWLNVPDIHYPDDKDTLKKAALTAQLNLGNIAALAWQNNKETETRLGNSMTMYQSLYDDPAYSVFMGFTADVFVKETSYAARGASRNRSGGDVGGFPPLVDVSNLRAIGYGAALNTSGSCAGLFYGASQFLKCDEHGNLDNENLTALKEIYLKDPIAQDRINRATYGVVMANMDTAWEYLGYHREVKDNITTVSKHGHSFVPDTLIQSEEHIQSTLQTLKSQIAQYEEEERKLGKRPLTKQESAELLHMKETIAAHMLAKIDKEYRMVSTALLTLHQTIKDGADLPRGRVARPDFSKRETIDADRLLAELPKALREQVQDSLFYSAPNREALAQTFRKVVTGEIPKPKRPDEKSTPQERDAFAKIYYAMGHMFEVFENVPRAFTRLRWALDVEFKQNGVAR